MRVEEFRFGLIRIDGRDYEYDVVIARGRVRKRKKKRSRAFRRQFGHTPLSLEEKIPWRCTRLIVGTGAYGGLPVMEEVEREANLRGVTLSILPTPDAIEEINRSNDQTHAILHVTC
jgi:hypothetical protein